MATPTSPYLENIDNSGVSATPSLTDTAIQPTTAISNPDGTPVTTPTQITQDKVNVPTVPSIDTPNVSGVLPQAASTMEGALGGVTASTTNVAATAQAESSSQIDLTKQLSAIDSSQMNTKISNAQENQSEFQRIAEAQMVQKNANEEAYQQTLRQNQGEEIAALRLQQKAENSANEAAAADMKIKTDNAERELQIANDVAMQQSSISFAKLGLSFSGAAINQAQQIFTTGMYNLSSLKSGNAKNYADLQVKINSLQFDHIKQIGTLVSETADKEFASKERLRQFIGDTQNNILTDKKEAQKAIQDAITTYKGEAQARQDKLFSTLNSANATLQTATKDITNTLTASQNVAKSKIDMYLNNGQWASLAPETKVQLEKDAGVPPNTSMQTATVKVTQGINDRLKEEIGKTVAIPTAMLKNMQADVNSYMSLGYPMPVAVQMVTDKYKSSIPEYVKMKQASVDSVKLDNAKTQAEIDKLASEAKENLASIDKMKADTARAAVVGRAAEKPGQKYLDTVVEGGKTYNRYTDTSTGKVIYETSDLNISTGGKLPVKAAPSMWSVPVGTPTTTTLKNEDGTPTS